MLNSLSLRLLIILVVTLSASIGLSTLYSYHEAQHEIQELFDAQLAQEARIIYTSFIANPDKSEYQKLQKTLEQNARLIPDLSASARAFDDLSNQHGHVYERKIAFQIWDKNRQLVLRSLSAPDTAMVPDKIPAQTRGFHDVVLQGKKWRVFGLWNSKAKYIIHTGEEYDIRDELAREISLNWILTTGLVSPLIIILVMLAVYYGFKPLRSIVRQISQRDPRNLQPITTKNVPDEIQPLLDELNKLFVRVSHTLERERRFTDDAAHELRTPLAALKTQAQVAMRSQQTEERNTALEYIIKSVDHLTHMLQQLLDLARLGAGEVNINLSPVNLYTFTNNILSQLAPMGLAKNIEIEFSCENENELNIMADKSALSMLLRNLIDNAIRYTPAHGQVTLHTFNENRNTILCITDTGPGIADEHRSHIFERFYRVTGSGEKGCGLGLSIARHCADMLNARIELYAYQTGKGLTVCIYFKHQDL